MSGTMDVDPEMIRLAGQNVSLRTEDTATSVAGFQQQLASYGEPWGNDDLGSVIGLSYLAIFEVAMESMATNLEALGYHGDTLVQHADDLDDADDTAAAANDDIGASSPNLAI